ncbi:MAG: ribosome maturation factor RimM [Bacteroidia bacterium]
MRVEDCFLLGRILKPHSIHGESKVYLDVDYIEDYEDLESVYVLQGNKLTPFFIENLRIQGPNQVIVQFRGIDDRNQAEELVGLEIYLPEDELPELDEDQFYFHEIKGFTLVDERHGTLGQVLKVEEYPAQAVIVMRWQGKEVLIPIAGDIVGNIDREKQVLHTKLPEGLLEVYLNPNAPENE